MPDFADFAQPITQSLSTELYSAIQNAPLPPLGSALGSTIDSGQGSTTQSNAALATLLDGGIGDHLIGVASSRQMECLSGFWLIAGDIDRSHSISQDLGSTEGSFLHGIMHRREGDFGNAKYWFRRVGSHPLFNQIDQLTDGHYSDPFDFVDQCQQATQHDQIDQCVRSQWTEWQALMVYLLG